MHDAHSHSAFRAVLPYFIAAYKSGLDKVIPPDEDCAIAWYRTTPADCCHDGGMYRVAVTPSKPTTYAYVQELIVNLL